MSVTEENFGEDDAADCAEATLEILRDLESDYLFDLFYSRYHGDYKVNTKMTQNLRKLFGNTKETADDRTPIDWKPPQESGLSNSEVILKKEKGRKVSKEVYEDSIYDDDLSDGHDDNDGKIT